LIGYQFEDRDRLVEAINSLIAGGKDQAQVIDCLQIIEEILDKNEDNSEIILEKVKTANKSNLKLIASKILSTLKSVGLDTIKAVKNKGVDGAVQWLFRLLELAN
jgi:hypothetical protein